MTRNLEIALQAAAAASEEICRVYEGSVDVQLKADGSPITRADTRANDAIRSVLAPTNIPVLSEEAIVPFEQRVDWSRFWLVDPLDGTKELLARTDQFSVNIALVEGGIPILGVIAAPALKMVWYAEAGGGAWETGAGNTARAINARAPWPVSSRMTTTRLHDSPASAEFARLNRISKSVRSGSAIKFVKVAASEVEFYARYAGSSEWDTGAGEAILREAGGFLLTIDGRSPLYNQRRLRHPYFVAWRPPLRWDEILLPESTPE